MTMVNFLLAGVGGQGTILASDVVAAVGLLSGHDVKKSEVHGMAQRGGSVTTHVRWGERVYSPLIGPGEVDFFVAFEKLEALRYIDMLRPGGVVLVNDYAIAPLSVSSGNDEYPSDERIQTVLSAVTPHVHLLPATAMAEELGNAKVNNVVLLGALAHFVGQVPPEGWREAIRERVPPKFVALNERAFAMGLNLMAERTSIK
jgi:indolepyruvate ferredoxin oxidoreductase beta subunit